MELGSIDYVKIFKESWTIWILSVCSVVAIAVALERWWYFGRIKVNPNKFLARFSEVFTKEGDKAASALCDKTRGPVSAVVKTGILNRTRSKIELDEFLTSVRMEQRLLLEKWLGILGTLGNTAPFIGLFGTVIGIIKAFHDLAVSGSGGPQVVAAGISEALVATAGGLMVAIPSVILYNYFMKKVKDYTTDMEVVSIRLLVLLKPAHG